MDLYLCIIVIFVSISINYLNFTNFYEVLNLENASV